MTDNDDVIYYVIYLASRELGIAVSDNQVSEDEEKSRTPEQMRWANGLCRFRELATTITI